MIGRRASILVCLAASGVLAPKGVTQGRQVKIDDEALATMFANVDRDADGRIAESEWRLKKTLFAEVDQNRDGYLTAAEVNREAEALRAAIAMRDYPQSFRERLARENVVPFDVDRDGRLTPVEYRNWLFAAADANADGALDIDECEQLAAWSTFRNDFDGSGEKLIARLDKNKDGKVAATEFRPTDSEFKSHDRNRDGKLSADEVDWVEPVGLAALANQSVDAVLERYDRDRDTALDKGEAPGPLAIGFERVDRDGDGKISREELDRALKSVQEAQLALLPPEFVARYDQNRDGKVSPKEFPGAAGTFARLDRNGDGFVSKADG
jgi:Ca2+-binding EF-hand superfamily protein